jgi:hypothetical protein
MSKLASLLLLTLLLTAPLLVSAQFEYVTNSDGTSVTITGYSGSAVVSIPTNINGLLVTDIGEEAFYNTGVTSITIPNSITNIASGAFIMCDSLTNAVIPQSVTSIGDSAFGDDVALETVTIWSSLTNIGVGVYSGCQSLTNVTIQMGVKLIQSNMFDGDGSLRSVAIPASVTDISDTAFGNSTDLSNIFFEGNAPMLGHYTFAILNPPELGEIPVYYVATAYYLAGTRGWAQFTSNTFIPADPPYSTNAEFIPAVMWNPTIQASGTNFGIQNAQYGFGVTGTTNLPIAIEACDDLTLSNWVVLQRLILTNGLFHFSEPLQSNTPARFYRIGFP